jgi:hypothetical protein
MERPGFTNPGNFFMLAMTQMYLRNREGLEQIIFILNILGGGGQNGLLGSYKEDCQMQGFGKVGGFKFVTCGVTPSHISNLETAKAKSSAGKDENGGDNE